MVENIIFSEVLSRINKITGKMNNGVVSWVEVTKFIEIEGTADYL